VAIIDRVKWDGSADVLAWKYPSEELSTWTQLIVNESQEAFLVRGGVYEGPFGAGRHTLSTENIPLLRELMGLPFGGASPFSAEVWFVDKLTRLDIRWGTPDPIQLQDPKFGIMVPVRAFGQYGIRIDDAKRFLLKLVGTLPGFDTDTLSDYLRGLLTTRIKTDIANAILGSGLSVLEIAPRLDDLSNTLEASLAAEIAEYGITLTQFNIHSINMPEDDPAVQTLKSALARRAEMGIVGFDYQQQRRFDVLETAAANEGSAGTLMGAGVGLGLAPALGQAFAQAAQQVQAAPATSPAERIRLLKELGELRAQGILSDTEFENEKRRILAG
jgi:membrane protease subunit (stomatin/prohibitin family)